MRIGMPELLVILAIVVVLFGARRLPDLGSGLAKAIKGFRTGIADEERDQDKGEAKGDEKAPPGDKPEA